MDLDDSQADESPVAECITQGFQLGAVAVLHCLGKHPLDQFRCDAGNVVIRISEAALGVHFRSASEEHRLYRLLIGGEEVQAGFPAGRIGAVVEIALDDLFGALLPLLYVLLCGGEFRLPSLRPPDWILRQIELAGGVGHLLSPSLAHRFADIVAKRGVRFDRRPTGESESVCLRNGGNGSRGEPVVSNGEQIGDQVVAGRPCAYHRDGRRVRDWRSGREVSTCASGSSVGAENWPGRLLRLAPAAFACRAPFLMPLANLAHFISSPPTLR
jgi:hypothetical protein